MIDREDGLYAALGEAFRPFRDGLALLHASLVVLRLELMLAETKRRERRAETNRLT